MYRTGVGGLKKGTGGYLCEFSYGGLRMGRNMVGRIAL